MQELFPLIQNYPLTQIIIIGILILIGCGLIIKPLFKIHDYDGRKLVATWLSNTCIALILCLIAMFIIYNIENKQKQAFEHKDYTIIKEDNKLKINSNSKYLKSKKFSIYSEKDNIIEVKYDDLFYKIDETKETIIEK